VQHGYRSLAAAALATALVAGGCSEAEPRIPAGASLDRLRRDIAAYVVSTGLYDIRAVLVLVGDRVLVEEYYGATAAEYRNAFSVTESVLATLVGIAVEEGFLDLGDPLRELLPDYADEMSPEVGDTTLDQLLTMTGGFKDSVTGDPDDLFTEPDWVAASLGSHVGGRSFAYTDRGAHLVAAALARATGRSVLDYAREKLFDPLGVDTEPAAEPSPSPDFSVEYEAAGFAWPVDPQGVHHGWGNLKLRARDMAALGSLYLDGGAVDGKQVVPATWVRDATAMHVPASGAADGYGYLWWADEVDGSPASLAIGTGGQLVAVVPDRELVVVVSSHVGDHPTVSASVTTYLVDAVIAPAVRLGR
jgi:CubicO group peptidase (beta-lactamase class C family)